MSSRTLIAGGVPLGVALVAAALLRTRGSRSLPVRALTQPIESVSSAVTASQPLRSVVAEPAPARSGVPSLTYVADTSSDPEVIAEALRALPSVYAARGSRKLTPDAALERVLVKHLRAPQTKVVAAALSAARIPLMMREPNAAVTSAVAELAKAERSAEERHAALDTLNLIRPDRRAPLVLSAFEQALSASEPDVLSAALFALAQSGPSLNTLADANRANLARLVQALCDHADPGVRGRALEVLAAVDWLLPADARYESGERHLSDDHPYVRAQAADLLFRCGQAIGIHKLIEHVSDLELARYELRFNELDGSPGLLLHTLPGRPRVAEAALLALLALSETIPGVERLNLTLTSSNSDALVLQNAELARSWYRAHSASIPQQAIRAPRP